MLAGIEGKAAGLDSPDFQQELGAFRSSSARHPALGGGNRGDGENFPDANSMCIANDLMPRGSRSPSVPLGKPSQRCISDLRQPGPGMTS